MMIRRLTRLPPREIFKLVVGQITPILLYGAGLHHEELEEGRKLLRAMSRWVIEEWTGSSSARVADMTRIGTQMIRKKV